LFFPCSLFFRCFFSSPLTENLLSRGLIPNSPLLALCLFSFFCIVSIRFFPFPPLLSRTPVHFSPKLTDVVTLCKLRHSNKPQSFYSWAYVLSQFPVPSSRTFLTQSFFFFFFSFFFFFFLELSVPIFFSFFPRLRNHPPPNFMVPLAQTPPLSPLSPSSWQNPTFNPPFFLASCDPTPHSLNVCTAIGSTVLRRISFPPPPFGLFLYFSTSFSPVTASPHADGRGSCSPSFCC